MENNLQRLRRASLTPTRVVQLLQKVVNGGEEGNGSLLPLQRSLSEEENGDGFRSTQGLHKNTPELVFTRRRFSFDANANEDMEIGKRVGAGKSTITARRSSLSDLHANEGQFSSLTALEKTRHPVPELGFATTKQDVESERRGFNTDRGGGNVRRRSASLSSGLTLPFRSAEVLPTSSQPQRDNNMNWIQVNVKAFLLSIAAMIVLFSTIISFTSENSVSQTHESGVSALRRILTGDNSTSSDTGFGGTIDNLASSGCAKFNTAIYCALNSGKCTWDGTLGCVPTPPGPLPTFSPVASISSSPTKKPSRKPSKKPTNMPTSSVTAQLTSVPTDQPTSQPTKKPTPRPVLKPTSPSSHSPASPTKAPTLSTLSPTKQVTAAQTTNVPTTIPTVSVTTTDGEVDPTAGYDIQLLFSNPSTAPAVVAAFVTAKNRWESIILNDIQSTYIYKAWTTCFGEPTTSLSVDTTVDDLLIFADILYIDGPGGILGSAGPCIATSTGGKYARVGLMKFDSADLEAMSQDGSLESVILHEMAHVIGFGTLWVAYHLKDPTGAFYIGSGGEEGYQSVGGSGTPLIELNGGPGTAGGHWDESSTLGELMTGWLSPNAKLSLLTVQSFQDMGFNVNPSAADPGYKLPGRRTLRDLDETTTTITTESGTKPAKIPCAFIPNIPIIIDNENFVPYDEDGNPQNKTTTTTTTTTITG